MVPAPRHLEQDEPGTRRSTIKLGACRNSSIQTIALTESDLREVERRLRLSLPPELKAEYLRSNGGEPTPYVYEDDSVDTVVTRFLPLKSSRGRRTAVDVYQDLVLDGGLAPAGYFPFASDGGGDYFFVECVSGKGTVFFLASDHADEQEGLRSLGVGVHEFFLRLKAE